MISISKLWKKLQTKEYRDGYAEAQLSIEIPFQIRALRRARGWTQAQLADRCGIPQARISHIEQPGRDPLSLRTLYRLSSAFDVGLLVQFVSFSELVNRETAFNPESFHVASFGDDHLLEEPMVSNDAYAQRRDAVVSMNAYEQLTGVAQSVNYNKLSSAQIVFSREAWDKETTSTRIKGKAETKMYLYRYKNTNLGHEKIQTAQFL